MLHPKKVFLFLLVSALAMSMSRAQVTYPPRTYGDSLHAPFYHGVASGDPLFNAVIIWTRITPAPLDYSPLTVNYQFASDSLFSAVISSGSVITDSSFDWTLKVDVSGLTSNTIYYYRFDDGMGNTSQVGRTRTAPTGAVSDLKFAVFSCSSVFSGFFNSYARVAEKADSLNAAIHLGDYIYDFIDAEEQVRVPVPYPGNPSTLEQWRDRHEYYLLDPDLRQAKAMLPWICMWDNHDQDCGGSYNCYYSGGNEAFIEWMPIRVPDTTNQLNIYRTISYGDLADIIVTDALMFRHGDTLPNGAYNMLGNTQLNWLTQQLQNSTAKWKLVPQQRMVGGWYTNGIPAWVLAMLPNNGPIFDDGSWDGFPDTKAALFDFVRTNFIDNLIMLSGDAHVSIAQDLIEDPHNSLMYDAQTGIGSVGVEFLPTSVTRGNMDEAGAPVGLFDAINNMDRAANPQHQFTDFFNHGYGILHLMPDSSTAEFWYTPKLIISPQDSLGATLVVKDGENRWSRNSGYSNILHTATGNCKLFPNPANVQIALQFETKPTGPIFLEVLDAMGRIKSEQLFHDLNNGNQHVLNITNLSPGFYFIRVNQLTVLKFIKQ